MSSTATHIGIAVVEQGGWFLVGIRPPGRPLAGYAEFPGGKCEPGESAETCAVRECREETGMSVTVERLLQRCDFTYPHGAVVLHFYLCHPSQPCGLDEIHQGYRWVSRVGLAEQRFPDANADLVARLIAGTE